MKDKVEHPESLSEASPLRSGDALRQGDLHGSRQVAIEGLRLSFEVIS